MKPYLFNFRPWNPLPFNTIEESVEWNNPLDVIYEDLADLKTKIDSTDEAEMKTLWLKLELKIQNY